MHGPNRGEWGVRGAGEEGGGGGGGAEWNGGDEDHHNTWIKVGGTYYVDNQVLASRALRYALQQIQHAKLQDRS
jgi:hypothetical protein